LIFTSLHQGHATTGASSRVSCGRLHGWMCFLLEHVCMSLVLYYRSDYRYFINCIISYTTTMLMRNVECGCQTEDLNDI